MIGPELWHILFAAFGLGLGWYLKHQSIKVPPEILTALEGLLAQKHQQQSRGLLQELLDAAKTTLQRPN